MTLSIAQKTKLAEYSIVLAELPGRGAEAIGVLLLDPESGELHLRFRRDWETFAEEEDREVLAELASDLAQQARDFGGATLLEFLEATLSNVLRISDREQVEIEDAGRALARLYREHVPANVLPVRTHLPQYSLKAAAGRFGSHEEVKEEGWIEAPEDLRLTEDMFVAHVEGDSMEPKIPAGSLCVFRHHVTGSRQGRIVLVELAGLVEHGGEVTIKRYRSRKRVTEEGWEHEAILMEPLNPKYEAWELRPDQLKVIGEFVRVLEP